MRSSKTLSRLAVVIALFAVAVPASALPLAPAPTIQILDVDGYISAAEASAVVASGTADPNYDVVVRFDDTDDATTPVIRNVRADANGNWTTGPTDLRSLSDGRITAGAATVALLGVNIAPAEEVPVEVQVNENPGLSEEATDASIKDASIPTLAFGIDGDNDGGINAAEVAAGIRVYGDTEALASVSILINRVAFATPSITRSVGADGSGHFVTAPLDLSVIPDGLLRFTVTAADAAANAITATRDVLMATTTPATPTVAFDETTVDGVLTQSDITAVTLSGTVTPGVDVVIVVDDGDPRTHSHTYHATGDTGGAYMTDPQNLSNLLDSPPVVTATAVAVDLVGNSSAPATTTIAKSAGNGPFPPGIEILDNPPDHPADDPNAQVDGFVDEIANLDETSGGTDLRVLVSLEDEPDPNEIFFVQVTVDDDDPATAPAVSDIRSIARSSSQTTRTFHLDVRGLNDGIITAVATISNGLGYTTHASDTSLLDLHAPTTTAFSGSESIFAGPFISFAFETASFEGSSEDIPATTPVLVTYVTATNGNTVLGPWYSVPHLTHQMQVDWVVEDKKLPRGTWTINARSMDEAGNLEAVGQTFTLVVM